MIVHIDKLIKHLKNQISVAEHLQSDFVYITKREAEACLELAESKNSVSEKDLCRMLFNRCHAMLSGAMCNCCIIRNECEAMRDKGENGKNDNKANGKKI